MSRTTFRRLLPLALAAVVAVPLLAACAPRGAGAPGPSGTTCWEKRAFYQERNLGLKETLGSGTTYSAPCVLSAYVAIEQAAAEFGVSHSVDALVRVAACESLLQPAMIGQRDPTDAGLFQWNESAPRYWWSTTLSSFNAWQERQAALTGGAARYASGDRLDPYNSARVAAWYVMAYPRNWGVAWHCKGVYDPAVGRIR
jgi:hypothetical protein